MGKRLAWGAKVPSFADKVDASKKTQVHNTRLGCEHHPEFLDSDCIKVIDLETDCLDKAVVFKYILPVCTTVEQFKVKITTYFEDYETLLQRFPSWVNHMLMEEDTIWVNTWWMKNECFDRQVILNEIIPNCSTVEELKKELEDY